MAADPLEGAKTKTVEALSTRMDRADWYSSFSDDFDVRQRGSKEVAAIYDDLKTLGIADLEAARDVWQKHAPTDLPRPEFLIMPTERKERDEAWQALQEAMTELYPEDLEAAREARKKDGPTDLPRSELFVTAAERKEIDAAWQAIQEATAELSAQDENFEPQQDHQPQRSGGREP